MFNKLLVLLVSLFTASWAHATTPNFDPVCQEHVRAGEGLVQEADNVTLTDNGTLLMDFASGTILVTPDAVLPDGLEYQKRAQTELNRGYTPLGAIIMHTDGSQFVTLTVGQDSTDKKTVSCETIDLHPLTP